MEGTHDEEGQETGVFPGTHFLEVADIALVERLHLKISVCVSACVRLCGQSPAQPCVLGLWEVRDI